MTRLQSVLKKRVKKRSGTTLVEMIVTLLLISIMLTMATASLSSASKMFIRVQKTQYAQSILDTIMTELRGIAGDATQYVKIYESGKNIVDISGNLQGDALEFINEEGYVELITTDTSGKITLLNSSDEQTEETQQLEEGKLFLRYYALRSTTNNLKKYNYCWGTGKLVARAVTPVYGSGFYMGNYVKVEYSVPSGTNAGDKISSITATISLYSDSNYSDDNKIVEDSEILYFQNPVIFMTDVTAIYNTNTLN